jgi:hypothetical protein
MMIMTDSVTSLQVSNPAPHPHPQNWHLLMEHEPSCHYVYLFILSRESYHKYQYCRARLRKLRRISGPKRDEVTGGCKKLHNEELLDFKSSPSITRMI